MSYPSHKMIDVRIGIWQIGNRQIGERQSVVGSAQTLLPTLTLLFIPLPQQHIRHRKRQQPGTPSALSAFIGREVAGDASQPLAKVRAWFQNLPGAGRPG